MLFRGHVNHAALDALPPPLLFRAGDHVLGHHAAFVDFIEHVHVIAKPRQRQQRVGMGVTRIDRDLDGPIHAGHQRGLVVLVVVLAAFFDVEAPHDLADVALKVELLEHEAGALGRDCAVTLVEQVLRQRGFEGQDFGIVAPTWKDGEVGPGRDREGRATFGVVGLPAFPQVAIPL